jgi:hypothetical protein
MQATIDKPCPTSLGVDPNCPSRYEAEDNGQIEEIAILTELHESLPVNFQVILCTPSRSSAFAETVSPVFFDIPLADLLCKFWARYRAQRAQLVSRARQVAGNIFKLSGTSASNVQSSDALKRANDSELQALLQDPSKPGEAYPLLAPMLFPSKKCDDLKCLFQAEPLMLVCHRIFLCQCSRH